MSVILVTGLVEPAAAAATNTASVATDAFLAPTAATAAESADIALDGFGDAEGYHLQIGRGADGFAWQEIAALRPADMDVQSWTGYQCLSGDGRFAAVTILPSDQANDAAARDHGAFAYSVDLGSAQVHPIAAGVGLKYYSPGCGAADTAVLTTMLGTDQGSTVLSTADLSSGAVAGSSTVSGQVTSAVRISPSSSMAPAGPSPMPTTAPATSPTCTGSAALVPRRCCPTTAPSTPMSPGSIC